MGFNASEAVVLGNLESASRATRLRLFHREPSPD
jgi:hypothetical protein